MMTVKQRNPKAWLQALDDEDADVPAVVERRAKKVPQGGSGSRRALDAAAQARRDGFQNKRADPVSPALPVPRGRSR